MTASQGRTPPVGPSPTFVFDIVGTLVDEVGTVGQTLADVLRIAVDPAMRFAEQWQTRLGAAVEDVVGGDREWADYETLRRDALRGILREHGLRPDGAGIAALDGVGSRLRPFPGAPAELTALSEAGRVVGLTNTTLAAASAFSAAAGLRWHALLSAGSVRAYKPQPTAYRLAIDALELVPEQTVFVAAHPWDLRAAQQFGFRTAFYPRPHADQPLESDSFDFTISSLRELVGR